MSEPTREPPSKPSTRDVSTRAAARAWTRRRLRTLGLLLLLAVVLSPVASAAVVAWNAAKRGVILTLGELALASLMWGAIATACVGIVAVIIALKYATFARRAAPILERGVEAMGRVVEVRSSTRRGGGVNHHKLTISIQTSDGGLLDAMIEEMEGTELPVVEIGAPATIWTLERRSIVGTCGALFTGV